MINPFHTEWTTPFQAPPFDRIRTEHFLPAFEAAIKDQRTAIETIAAQSDPPTFENTIGAMERAALGLARVRYIFEALSDADTNDALQEIAHTVTPKLSQLQDDITLNERLFARIKELYERRTDLRLSVEQQTVLDNYYKHFVRGGAMLDAAGRTEFRAINEELGVLMLKFGENLLKETVAVALMVDNADDLAGLPHDVITAAAETAAEKGMPGKWAFTLQKPSFIPFLQYGDNREFRERLFRAYCNRGNNDNEHDNKAILTRIVELRTRRAQLLGYPTHAEFVLERCMARSPDAVQSFLNNLWPPAVRRAGAEAAAMQEMIHREGKTFTLAAWDWWYYAERVKKAQYDLDEEMLRPYFPMEQVRKGVFDLANRLYGITFVPRPDIPVYHPEVEVFEVLEEDGSPIGLFYTDFYPRESKRSGAWSGAFQDESFMNGEKMYPIIFNVGNFAKPTADKPSLMSVDDVKTLFHEFGHALHSLFARTVYPNAQTVPVDFVELPSQVLENWALHPKVLPLYARHYRTGQPMPQELIEKLHRSSLFNQGFETVEYLAAASLDMAWHTMPDGMVQDVRAFETKAMAKIGLPKTIEPRYLSTNFQHIFSTIAYSAGYYSYIWAAVLDADAFEAFVETGNLFDRETAQKFRNEVLAPGGREEVKALYKRFRGREPEIGPLLRRRGLD